MDHLPIFMALKGRPVLVVGGGTIAARKADLLLSAGAEVTAIAPEVGGEMERLVASGRVRMQRGLFSPEQIIGHRLVIAATDDEAVNQAVFRACEALQIPVNVADQPDLCSFILPAIVERGPLTLAVSTGGRSPVLARHLKARLETLIPSGYGLLADLLGRYRPVVKRRFAVLDDRRRFWERLLDGPIVEMATAQQMQAAEALLERSLLESPAERRTAGEVWLIGAGPGDPDLLTLKALRLLQSADVIVHDHLVPESILQLARREAERICVGKRKNHHTLPQEDINTLLVSLARQGLRVARVKGGDPFVFGRGAEEMEEVVVAGIPCLAVPGITAASGCSAYAGIPLTHRDHAQSVRFVTGHTRADDMGLDWPALVAKGQTLVFYMGVGNLARIAELLQAHGMSPDMPAAIVERVSLPAQRVLEGTLESLPRQALDWQPKSPSLVVVGEVVRLRRRMGMLDEGGREVPLALELPIRADLPAFA